jgi:hypothetical protein
MSRLIPPLLKYARGNEPFLSAWDLTPPIPLFALTRRIGIEKENSLNAQKQNICTILS